MYAELINYTIRSTACLAFFYAFYTVILRKETCFRFNRGYLLITLVLSFVLPILNFSIALPTNSLIDPNVFILPEVIITDTAIIQADQFVNLFSILNIIYLIATLYLISRFFFRMYQLWKVINSDRYLHENKYIYEVIPTNGKLPTSSFLNYLFWDNTSAITDIEKQQIIAHEKVHISERHTYDVLLIELISIVFWFNPIIWLWKRAISENHEYLADAKASNGVDTYSKLLAKHTLALNGFEIIHPFKSSDVIKRLQMLKKYGQRTNWTKLFAVVPLLCFMIFTMSFSVEQILDKPVDINNEKPVIVLAESQESAPLEIIKNPTYNNLIDNFLDEKDYITSSKFTEKLAFKKSEPLSQISPLFLPIEDKEVFTIVEESAKPIGGMTEFYEYISRTLEYPKQARRLGISGRVFIEFIVDKNGNLTEVTSIKGIGGGCDTEAVRVISNSPPWKPGKQRGKAVKQKIVLPITFHLG